MASLIFNSFLFRNSTGLIDTDSDAFKVILAPASWTPNKRTHDFRDDVTEISGTGYTAGGKAATVTVSLDNANDRVAITLGDANWPASTMTARYAVYYKARGGAASADDLVAVVDFGADVSTTNGTFTLAASSLYINNP